MKNLFPSFFIALMSSMLLVPPLMRLSGWLQLMDAPDARKLHDAAIPRSGGIAIVVGALVPLLLWLPESSTVLYLLLGGAVIAAFGLLDDRVDLDYKWKFFGQLLAIALAMHGGLLIEFIPFFGLDPVPAMIAYPLTLLFMLGVTNAINFSDGLDGLAAGTSLLTLAAIAWLAFQSPLGAGRAEVALLALAVMGGICGFLRYNNHPALIFMGDAGSQFLGFMTAGLAVILTQNVNPAFNPGVILLLLGLPILDTLLVMTWRLRRGESPFLPDRKHFHHRLLEFGFRHYEAVSAIYLTHAVLVCLAVLLKYQSDLVVVSVFLIFSISVLAFFRRARVTDWRLHQPASEGEFVERRNLWLRRMTWLPHWSARGTEYAAGLFMIAAALLPGQVDRSLGVLGLTVAATFALASLIPDALRGNLRRLALYVAAVCGVYALTERSAVAWASDWVINGYVVLLGGMLVAAIRVTRRELFRTTPLDALIWFFVLVAMIVTEFSDTPVRRLGDAVVRLAVLFYVGEFLYSKGPKYYTVLSALAATAALLLAARGFGLLP